MAEMYLEAGQVEKYFYLVIILAKMKVKVLIW